jgi:hypothetical protein
VEIRKSTDFHRRLEKFRPKAAKLFHISHRPYWNLFL